MSEFFNKIVNHIRDFFDPMRAEAEEEKKDDFVLPLDESGKLIRPIGTVKAVPHQFKNRNLRQENETSEDVLSAVLPLDDESRALLEIAKAVRDKAYAKYSGFQVGAALVGKSGQVYLGVNIENASYPAGLCAERSALASAVTAGETEFSAIAIVGGEEDEPCFPCGICRQVLSEFCPPDFPVILADGVYALGGLLPHSFVL